MRLMLKEDDKAWHAIVVNEKEEAQCVIVVKEDTARYMIWTKEEEKPRARVSWRK